MEAVVLSTFARLRSWELPFQEVKYLELIESVCSELGGPLAEVVDGRIRGMLHVDVGSGTRLVVGVGRDRSAAILAYLRSSDTPVRTREILAEFGRGHLPREILFLGRGLVGLEQHFPDIETWAAALVPRCIAMMSESGTARQWHAIELMDSLRAMGDVPERLNRWHLASILKRSPSLTYLGRLRVSLKDAGSPRERIQFKEAILDVLRLADGPLDLNELLRRVWDRTSAPELALRMRLQDSEFVRMGERRWGLAERDVPGGLNAVIEIREFAHSLLQQREIGLTPHQLWQNAEAEGLPLAGFTPLMLASVAAGSDLIRSGLGGSIGLAHWDTVRAPTQGQIVRRHLEQGNGVARIEAIALEIGNTSGKAPTRGTIGQIAYQFGGRMRGDEIQIVDWDAWKSDEEGDDIDEQVTYSPTLDLDRAVGVLVAYRPPDDPSLDAAIMRRIYEVIDDPATGASASDQIFIDDRIALKLAVLGQAAAPWMHDLAEAASALYDLWLHHRTHGAQLSERALRYVRACLHYLVDPADVIPDDTELIGHLDDAHALQYGLDQLTAQSDWLGAGDI